MGKKSCPEKKVKKKKNQIYQVTVHLSAHFSGMGRRDRRAEGKNSRMKVTCHSEQTKTKLRNCLLFDRNQVMDSCNSWICLFFLISKVLKYFS